MGRRISQKNVYYVRKSLTEQQKEYENNSINLYLQRLMREKNSRK